MRRLVAGSIVAVSLWSGSAWGQAAATPGPLQPVPNGLNVSVLRPTAVQIKWVISGVAPSATATSPVGRFLTGSPTSGTFTGAGGAASNINANCLATDTANTKNIGNIVSSVVMKIDARGVGRAVETLIIPASVSERALRSGIDTFFYCRSFPGVVAGTTPAAATVTCKQGSSAYANFSIARIEMFFENRRREITIPLGLPNLRVFADVAYNGSGLLRAVWEVAEVSATTLTAAPLNAPPTRFDTPVDPTLVPRTTFFRTLNVVNQHVGFGDRVLLTNPPSPPLPTNQPGIYLVNLRFVEPPVPFEIPVARYFVQGGEHPQRTFLIPLQAPADAAVLPARLFGFQWGSGAPRVSHYRLDVYAYDAPPPESPSGVIASPATNPSSDSNIFLRPPREIAGGPGDTVFSALVPATATSFSLRQNQLARLVPGRSYTWRIKGLDQSGNIVAESGLRRFTLQPR